MTESQFPLLPFDPRVGILPTGVELSVTPGGQVVLVLVAPSLRLWASEALISLARGWSAGGQAVVLVDGDLEQPLLAALPGALASEGVSDVLHFGVSPSRAVHSSKDLSFQFVPAGSVLAESGHLEAVPLWAPFLEALRKEDRIVVLALTALPGERPSLASLADRLLRIADGTPDEPRDAPVVRPPLPEPSRGRKGPLTPGKAAPPRRRIGRILGLSILLVLGAASALLSAAWFGWVSVPPELTPYWVNLLTWGRSFGLLHR